MLVKTKCSKCGTEFSLDFGEMTKEQALEQCERIDRTPRECPGHHTELNGWKQFWSLEDAIHRAFDLGQGEHSKTFPTDREYVQRLLDKGLDVIDGGAKRVPEHKLPSIHDIPGLEHLGFGDFGNHAVLLERCDSPRGTRFYVRKPR